MAKIELKQPIVEKISANIKDAASVVVVDYRGITVAQDTQLRKQLREAGVVYKVYKNTFMNFAFKGTDCEGLSNLLEGPSAMATCDTDATAAARVLCKFAKKAPALEVKGGVVEGSVLSAAQLNGFGELPSKNALVASVLGTFLAPISSLAFVLDQVRIQKEGGAAAE